jgi:transposase InsO family protein
MFVNSRRSRVSLPKGWTSSVKSAVVQTIALAHYAIVHTRSWAADSRNGRVRLAAENNRLRAELALRDEQERIKDVRMAAIPPHRRPQYPPTERMAILELKAARGWSLEQTAKAFLVTAATVAFWMKRLDEEGSDALVQLRQPVNKFPDFVRHVVQRLKTLCPSMGKVKIAQTLARAGLHLGSTTVHRILKGEPCHKPPTSDAETADAGRIVTARYPDHVWHVDLTVVPTGGFWTSWVPFALPQCWPFCHWVAIVIDHFSRRVMGITAFKNQPTCEAVCGFLGRTIAKVEKSPRYIVCDRGTQFDCDAFRKWCKRNGIKRPRYGAIGKHGSIAVVERVILTTKCLLSRLLLVPYRREAFLRELTATVDWYNECRPHTWLGGETPNERYNGRFPANRRPRFEPRSRWPCGSPCARPWALARGSPGTRLTLDVSFHAGQRHLPIVKLRRVA